MTHSLYRQIIFDKMVKMSKKPINRGLFNIFTLCSHPGIGASTSTHTPQRKFPLDKPTQMWYNNHSTRRCNFQTPNKLTGLIKTNVMSHESRRTSIYLYGGNI